MATIDLLPPAGAGSHEDLAARVRELELRLDRERARNAGLEHGIGALSMRVEALGLENLELRRKLEHHA